MVGDCNVRKGNALFDLGRLADIGQVQIVLGKSGAGQFKNDNTNSSWPKCFHNLCVVERLPFSDFRAFRYQIIVSLSPSLINARAGGITARRVSRFASIGPTTAP